MPDTRWIRRLAVILSFAALAAAETASSAVYAAPMPPACGICVSSKLDFPKSDSLNTYITRQEDSCTTWYLAEDMHLSMPYR